MILHPRPIQSRMRNGPAKSTPETWKGKLGVTLGSGKFPIMGFMGLALMTLHSLQLFTVLLANLLPVMGQ